MMVDDHTQSAQKVAAAAAGLGMMAVPGKALSSPPK